jgi:hypothetical protein
LKKIYFKLYIEQTRNIKIRKIKMKSFKKNERAVTPVIGILLLIIGVVVVAALAGVGGDTPSASTGTDDSTTKTSGLLSEYSGDVSFKLYNADGKTLITSGESTTVDVYVTKPNFYTSEAQVIDAINNDGIVDPMTAGSFATGVSPDGDGLVTIDDILGDVAANGGEQYGIVIFDEATVSGTNTFNTMIGTFIVEGYSIDGVEYVKIVSANNDGATVGSSITLTERGTVGFYDGTDEIDAYVKTSDNSDLEDASVTFGIGVADEYQTVKNAVIYLDVIDDVANVADVTLTEVKLGGTVLDFEELADFENANSDLEDAIIDNAPTAVGTMYVCEISNGVYYTELSRAKDLDDSIIPCRVTYDADMTAVTVDEGNILVYVVAGNVLKNEVLETVDFEISILDAGTQGFNYV